MKASEIKFRGKRIDNEEIVEGYYSLSYVFDSGDPESDAAYLHWIYKRTADDNEERYEVHPDSIETVQKLYTQEEVDKLLQKQKKICAEEYQDKSYESDYNTDVFQAICNTQSATEEETIIEEK